MPQDIALVRRADDARPGTRGPHENLFQGGIPVARKAEMPEPTIAERITSFADARRLTKAETAVFRVVATHVLRNDELLVSDGFSIADQAGISYDDYAVARDKLLSVCAIRTKSVGAMGVDGLDLYPRLPL